MSLPSFLVGPCPHLGLFLLRAWPLLPACSNAGLHFLLLYGSFLQSCSCQPGDGLERVPVSVRTASPHCCPPDDELGSSYCSFGPVSLKPLSGPWGGWAIDTEVEEPVSAAKGAKPWRGNARLSWGWGVSPCNQLSAGTF